MSDSTDIIWTHVYRSRQGVTFPAGTIVTVWSTTTDPLVDAFILFFFSISTKNTFNILFQADTVLLNVKWYSKQENVFVGCAVFNLVY